MLARERVKCSFQPLAWGCCGETPEHERRLDCLAQSSDIFLLETSMRNFPLDLRSGIAGP